MRWVITLDLLGRLGEDSAAITVQFRSNWQSRITHPPVDHELWSMSHVTRASVEPPSGHTGPKLP
jgi:hypothetical protein